MPVNILPFVDNISDIAYMIMYTGQGGFCLINYIICRFYKKLKTLSRMRSTFEITISYFVYRVQRSY